MALRITSGCYQDLTLTTLLFLLTLSFFIITVNGLEGQKISFEDLDLDEKLKILNKPYVKSIKTEEGDIIDCVNINKQPSFDHPLLKNHKIQMEPSSSLKEMKSTPVSLSTKSSEVISSLSCPFGTVPIKRTRKEDLIRAEMFMESQIRNIHPDIARPRGFHYAVLSLPNNSSGKYFGGSGKLNIQNPMVPKDQFSQAFMRLQGSPDNQIDSIQVGWMVNPTLTGDNYTRSFTLWTSGRKGCLDLTCPGFVQVNQKISLSSTFLKISVYGGEQFHFRYTVSQDKKSGNWWLKYEEDDIGYWPKSLFASLSSSVNGDVVWGGGVFSGNNQLSPAMGNGHYSYEGFKKAAYIQEPQIVDESNKLRYLDENILKLFTDCTCYSLDYLSRVKGLSYGFLYGGPGGNCGPY